MPFILQLPLTSYTIELVATDSFLVDIYVEMIIGKEIENAAIEPIARDILSLFSSKNGNAINKKQRLGRNLFIYKYYTSEVSKIVSLYPNTIRRYKEWGLIPPPERLENGRSRFSS